MKEWIIVDFLSVPVLVSFDGFYGFSAHIKTIVDCDVCGCGQMVVSCGLPGRGITSWLLTGQVSLIIFLARAPANGGEGVGGRARADGAI